MPKVPADFLPNAGWLLPKAARGSECAAQPFVYAVLTSRGSQLKGIPEDPLHLESGWTDIHFGGCFPGKGRAAALSTLVFFGCLIPACPGLSPRQGQLVWEAFQPCFQTPRWLSPTNGRIFGRPIHQDTELDI